MTFLLDTDICIAALRGVPGVVDAMLKHSPEELAVSSITRYELGTGVAKSAESRRQTELQKVETFLSMVHELIFDTKAANVSAEIRADLERKGTPIGPMDLLIAATALVNNLTLVTANIKEFSRIESLKLETW